VQNANTKPPQRKRLQKKAPLKSSYIKKTKSAPLNKKAPFNFLESASILIG
jgi:hypothetical protein